MADKKVKKKITGEKIAFWYNDKGVVVAKSIVECAPKDHVWDNPIPEESGGQICMRCNSFPEDVMDDTWFEEEYKPVIEKEVPF